jgi:hypothetical protein
VRIGGGTDGGVADGSGIEAEETVLSEANVVESSDLHEEVVWMLAVDDRFAEGGLSLLEELGVLASGDRRGFKGEHGSQGKLAGTKFAHGHRHDPVGGEELVRAAIG